jgi:1-deoxy-D-xylulose-5-phosphate reductoisomerase
MRRRSPVPYLDLIGVRCLNFQEADTERFPCLRLAYEAGRIGGTMPTVVNGADEVAVDAFLNGRIGFLDIPNIINQAMEAHQPVLNPVLDDILIADKWARNFAGKSVSILDT